jgi:alcohol dehydrogenase, propanol-preferring
MKAAVLHEFKKPLVIEEVARPSIGPSEILIEVEACGVCHSDLHVADGDWTQLSGIVKLPLILGHEIVGRVAERGGNVRELRAGDRVGVPWVHWTCGECEPCREGNENLCSKQQITGVTVDGGFAEYVKAPASHATKIPEKLTAEEAAPLLCAGVTVYRALNQVKISRGQRLAVFGVGGLGHLAVQIGRAMGAEVTAVDVAEEKLALAKKVGATATLNAAADEVVKTLRGAGGVHVAMVTSAAKSAYDMAFYCVRPRGALLAVGLPAENICFPPILMAAAEVQIRASAVGTRKDLKEVLEMAERGQLRCETHGHSLDQVNELFADLRRGRISGRAVIAPR